MPMIGEAFGCVSNTIRLRSGLYFDLANPKPEQFTFSDIAGALSKICRFGGQCEWFYSVAEHSYRCAIQAKDDGLSEEIQRACLLHDAAEAFCGDVVKPLKVMMPDYKRVEKAIEAVIAEKYGVDFSAPEVREIDWAMLIAERRAMFSPDKVEWAGENQVRRLNVRFDKWGPTNAEDHFAVHAYVLGIKIDDRGEPASHLKHAWSALDSLARTHDAADRIWPKVKAAIAEVAGCSCGAKFTNTEEAASHQCCFDED